MGKSTYNNLSWNVLYHGCNSDYEDAALKYLNNKNMEEK
jgi:hypothetical protein